jgi:hypothetical protein
VILAVHVPAGALLGRRAPSLVSALGWGAASHAALDIVPHDDPFGERAEIVATAVMLAVVAALTRADTRTMVGAIGGALPDLEHVLPWGRDGKLLFPTHMGGKLHGVLPLRRKLGGAAQLGLAAALAACLAAAREAPKENAKPCR